MWRRPARAIGGSSCRRRRRLNRSSCAAALAALAGGRACLSVQIGACHPPCGDPASVTGQQRHTAQPQCDGTVMRGCPPVVWQGSRLGAHTCCDAASSRQHAAVQIGPATSGMCTLGRVKRTRACSTNTCWVLADRRPRCARRRRCVLPNSQPRLPRRVSLGQFAASVRPDTAAEGQQRTAQAGRACRQAPPCRTTRACTARNRLSSRCQGQCR